ncbi:MAG: helicase HerA-like domain-containing protein [Eubacteriales bacterium]|nr:helicase HerA-like domain-containing protein [Eubacteriales bacterium]
MFIDNKIWVGAGMQNAYLLPHMANRHGLIAGATGTGKTVTLKVLAEAFSDMGVPCFVSDVKGDLAGFTKPGVHSDKMQERLEHCGVEAFEYKPYPTIFWDVFGEKGHPVRATVSEMGPLLLSRMLRLNETQSGILNMVFRIADDEGMLLLDLKDLKAVLNYVGENAKQYQLNYGNVSSTSVGAIQRAIGILEDEGGNDFFGEPALNFNDWMQVDQNGRGAINILSAEKLFLRPTMYSTFLLWLLSELYETLDEQGDSDKPRMVFFFDEAHLLFNDCPKELLEKIELVVRLIRSKGIGVYFITQNPADIPPSVLGQLGNRVQHALRAYTPIDQRGVKVAADTFRTNPNFDTASVISELKTGEALISFLDEKGAPSVVERCLILPPQSFIGAVEDDYRNLIIENSPFAGYYEEKIDRESAYEVLQAALVQNRSVNVQTTQHYIPQFNTYQRPAAVAQSTVTSNNKTGSLVYDPQSGKYIRTTQAVEQEVSYAPTMQAAPYTMTLKEEQAILKQQREEARELARIEKERKAEERRAYMDELREERVKRARKNDSVLGRVMNSAVSSVGRELGRSLTRGIFGALGGKRK